MSLTTSDEATADPVGINQRLPVEMVAAILSRLPRCYAAPALVVCDLWHAILRPRIGGGPRKRVLLNRYARDGNAGMVVWALSIGAQPSLKTFALAASYGDRPMLAALWERHPRTRCGHRAWRHAAGRGRMDLLTWMYWHNVPYHRSTALDLACKKGRKKVLRWAFERDSKPGLTGARCAILKDRIEILEWMAKHRVPLCSNRATPNVYLYNVALHDGPIRILKWLDWNYPQMRDDHMRHCVYL